ncbi:MAG: TonB-dependent receptor plug domain-containing protein [Limisphaerales bacterium]
MSTKAYWLRRVTGLSLACYCFVLPNSSTAQETNAQTAAEIARLKGLTFEELFITEITTVSRRAERLAEAPSAVQVISGEEIRRSGATSLPEALRLAPNLQVAQVNSADWAISGRGFTATTANKLLVLLDGRTVYTPLFSGVFWDVQNVMLEDVERIEVITGPGATLWGANAVNGVINVISKSAKDTQGALVSAGGGTFLNGFANLRYGDKLGEDLYFRVYGMGFDRDSTLFPNGDDGRNGWQLGQTGFRADWLPEHGEVITVQGNFYGGELSEPTAENSTVDGQNLLTRWTHPIAEGSDFTLQLYWDRTWRRIPGTFSEELNTYDVDLQYRVPIGDRNKFMAGLGYRLMADDVGNTAALAFLPEKRNLQLFSAFLQDEIALIEDELFLTLGSKFEHNDFTGFEWQPSARIAWHAATNQTLWAAVSRAVRSPSRIDTDFFVPGTAPYTIQGGGDRFESETLIAYEIGFRTQITRTVGASISTFFNDYDKIRSVEPIIGSPGQNIILNGLEAETYGVELGLFWQPTDWWRLRGGYTFLEKNVLLRESMDINQGRGEGNDPHHQFLLHSMLNLPANLQFDSVLRYVDNLNQLGPTVPAYFALDLRLAWRPSENWEIALVGQNLLDEQHPEFGNPATRQEIPRSVFGKVTWTY